MVRERDSVRSDIVLNNVDTVQGEDELDKAYKEIVKKTDIHPLKLVYIPAGMKFIKIDIGEKWAVIYFDYAQYKIKFFQLNR